MKKIILFSLLTVLLCSFKEPEGLKWYSWSEGVEMARRENKPIFLFAYLTWCDQCQRMEKKIINNKEILPLIAENFIPVKMDLDIDTTYLYKGKTLNRRNFLKRFSSKKFQGVPTVFSIG
ncbi:MAG: thioredoxin family protein [Bacteroidales bacterium]|nr:thioredoxin family protein [Bacteroidales bacterium]